MTNCKIRERFDTKVILLTKNSNIENNKVYKDSNFSDYITKPIDKNDLMNKINKWLGINNKDF